MSVVIPTYNRAYCLAKAIDSVLAQTHGEVEAIVVDDGSTDDTAKMMESRYGADPRVRYHQQANTGISGARNAGLALVRGAYVALLDSDDEWSPWKLELQVACMRAHPELGMTWTDMVAIDPDGNVTDPSYLRTMYGAYRWYPTTESLFGAGEPLERFSPRAADVAAGRRFYRGDIGSKMLMGNLVHTSTVVLTRARAESVKAFREDLRHSGEDYEFHLRTCRQGPVGYLDVASIRYQRGRSDQATKNHIHTAQNFLRVIEPILASEGERIDLPPRMRRAVLAEAHAWVGEELLEIGDAAGARRHLARSLSIEPGQGRTARLLLGACLPSGVRRTARRLYRAARGVQAEDRS